ncbi:MAG: SurA N-terminal domain-containing protein [Nitrospirae bacterium]|nr:SurA N-terminal domain-containing protein [Nitrospirota bacterium]
MLKILSSNKLASYIILVAITVIIIATFVFWGIGPKDKPQEAVVAQINNEKIYIEEFWRTYDNEYKRISETGAKKEDIEKLKLKDRVLNLLVDRAVLLIAAKKGEIAVTENELQDAITNTTYFQRNGVFDREVYTRALRLNRMTPQSFENMLREDLIINKMTRLVGETAELSQEEVKVLDSIGGGNQEQLLEVFRSNKTNLAVKAYVEGFKRQLDIKINRDIIS